jgi:hypothetical protein
MSECMVDCKLLKLAWVVYSLELMCILVKLGFYSIHNTCEQIDKLQD